MSNMVQNEWESVPKVVLVLLHLVQGLLHIVHGQLSVQQGLLPLEQVEHQNVKKIRQMSGLLEPPKFEHCL